MNQTVLKELTFNNLLEYSCELYKNNTLSTNLGANSYTYAEFYEKVHDLTKMLIDQGVQKGDRVALLCGNRAEWSMAYFSIVNMGAVVVPILMDFHANEIRHIIRHSEAKGIFISQNKMEVLDDVSESALEFVIHMEDLSLSVYKENSTLSKIITSSSQKIKEVITKIKKLNDDIKEDDIAVILYTSGTTGQSKGVMLSHKNLVSQPLSAKKLMDFKESDVFLSLLPLAHTFESTIGFLVPFFNGSSVVYIDKTPTPKIILDAMAKVRPTFILMVPLIIEKIFKNKILPQLQKNAIMRFFYSIRFFQKILHKIAGKKLIESFGGRVRFVGIGGAKLSVFVEQFLFDAEFPYAIGYGLTESAPLIAGMTPLMQKKVGSCGRVIENCEIKLDYNVSTNKDEGELLVKGPNIMQGYYKDEQRTNETIVDGWFKTGDLAIVDDDGYIFITGRSKNVIVGPSGENIYPEAIESVINLNEYVLESLVYDDGGRLVARVHLDYEKLDEKFKNEQADSAVHEKIEEFLEQLRVDVNKNVSSFSKIVKFIEQSEPFVMTPTKKIKRYLYTR